MNEYLPSDTLKWCQDHLQELGFNVRQQISDATAPHRTIYLQLRTAINERLLNDGVPELRLSEKPVGAINWQPLQTEDVRQIQLVGDLMENDAE